MSRLIRATDVAARYGGDEFVLILVHTDLKGARRVGEAIRRRVERLCPALGFEQVAVTASVGVATHEPEWADAAEVLKLADQAVYAAKASGGNTVR